jgi:hypothetical protein
MWKRSNNTRSPAKVVAAGAEGRELEYEETAPPAVIEGASLMNEDEEDDRKPLAQLTITTEDEGEGSGDLSATDKIENLLTYPTRPPPLNPLWTNC